MWEQMNIDERNQKCPMIYWFHKSAHRSPETHHDFKGQIAESVYQNDNDFGIRK